MEKVEHLNTFEVEKNARALRAEYTRELIQSLVARFRGVAAAPRTA